LSTLIQTNFPGSDAIGDLAESWSVGTGGTELIFRLVKGVTWHDRAPLTASDIKFNLDRVFFGTGGFVSYLRGSFGAAQAVEVIDSTTLKIILKQPSNSFLGNMVNPRFVNYAPHVPDAELERGKVVGTGAFVWEKWEPGVSITQTRNPNFSRQSPQGEAIPFLNAVRFFIIPDSSTHLAAFRTGQLDTYDPLDAANLIGKVETLKSTVQGLQTGLLPPTGWRTLMLKNETGLPFTDVNVRRALQYGADRQKFIDAAFQGLGFASGLANTSPEMGGKWAPPLAEQLRLPGMDPNRHTQDLAAARELLAKAGFGPQNKLKAEIAVINVGVFPTEAVVVVDLYRDLNVDLSIKAEETAIHNRRRQVGLKGNFQTLYLGNAFAIDDPSNTVGTFWTSDGPRNFSGWSDPSVDQWYQEQESAIDPARRAKLVADILLRIYDQAYDIILGWNTNPWVLRANVKNYTVPHSFANGWRYEAVWIDRS